MNKIFLSNSEILEIKDKIDNYIKNKKNIILNDVTDFTIAATLQLVEKKLDDLMTLDEAAETFQNLLDLVNDEKYTPLLNFLSKKGE